MGQTNYERFGLVEELKKSTDEWELVRFSLELYGWIGG